MPDLKLTQLASISQPLVGTDLFYVVRPGEPPGNQVSFTDLLANIPSSSVAWGAITGTLSDQTDLQNELVNLSNAVAAKAPQGDINSSGLTTTDSAILLGRFSPGGGDIEEIVIGAGLDLVGSELQANPAWGEIIGNLSDQSDLQAVLDLKAPLISPALVTPTLIVSDTATNTITYPVTLKHTHTGSSPTISYGTGIKFQADSATVADRDIGVFGYQWTTATDGTRSSKFSLSVVSTTSMSERFTVSSYGLAEANAINSLSYVGASQLRLLGSGYVSFITIDDSVMTANRFLTFVPPDVNATYTLPSASQTLASLAGTETLTNKSIAASQLTSTVAIANGGTASTTANNARAALNKGDVALTDGATVAIDASLGNSFTLTLTATGHAMGAPTNLAAGATYIFKVKQAGAGGYTLTWNSVFKWPGGTAPVMTATANAMDVISGTTDGTAIFCSFIKDVK